MKKRVKINGTSKSKRYDAIILGEHFTDNSTINWKTYLFYDYTITIKFLCGLCGSNNIMHVHKIWAEKKKRANLVKALFAFTFVSKHIRNQMNLLFI